VKSDIARCGAGLQRTLSRTGHDRQETIRFSGALTIGALVRGPRQRENVYVRVYTAERDRELDVGLWPRSKTRIAIAWFPLRWCEQRRWDVLIWIHSEPHTPHGTESPRYMDVVLWTCGPVCRRWVWILAGLDRRVWRRT
jgi:hypothetical protein